MNDPRDINEEGQQYPTEIAPDYPSVPRQGSRDIADNDSVPSKYLDTGDNQVPTPAPDRNPYDGSVPVERVPERRGNSLLDAFRGRR